MPRRLVSKPEFVLDGASLAKDEQVLRRSCLAQTLAAQVGGFGIKQKCPAAGDRVAERLGRYQLGVNLSIDGRKHSIVQNVSYFELVHGRRIDGQRCARLQYKDRPQNAVDFPPRRLQYAACLPERIDERPRRTIDARWFAGS